MKIFDSLRNRLIAFALGCAVVLYLLSKVPWENMDGPWP